LRIAARAGTEELPRTAVRELFCSWVSWSRNRWRTPCAAMARHARDAVAPSFAGQSRQHLESEDSAANTGVGIAPRPGASRPCRHTHASARARLTRARGGGLRRPPHRAPGGFGPVLAPNAGGWPRVPGGTLRAGGPSPTPPKTVQSSGGHGARSLADPTWTSLGGPFGRFLARHAVTRRAVYAKGLTEAAHEHELMNHAEDVILGG